MSTTMSSLFFTTSAALVVLVYAYVFPTALGFNLNMKNQLLSAPNLTHIQKHQLLLEASKKARYSTVDDLIHAPVSQALRSPFFYVEVGIGSPPVNVKLVFDTGSTTTWTQCAACKVCFPVAIPAFNPRLSSTYRRVPANHPLCNGGHDATEPSGEFCNFSIGYASGQQIQGKLSFETFTFGDMKVPDFVFGCGIYDERVNAFLNDTHNPISGVFGIGKDDPTSILYQLSSVTMLKFSYCLPLRIFEENDHHHHHHHHALLHFGKEAEIKSHEVAQTTPLLGSPGDSTYYAKLNAISVNGSILAIDPKLFVTPDIPWVVLDSGSSYTFFVEEAYKHVREAMVRYFLDKYGWKALKTSKMKFDLCYKKEHKQEIKDYEFPKVELHFEGAVMKLHRDAVFQAFDRPVNELCLMILPSNEYNLLGGFQMVNQRMLFDVGASKLSFVTESC